jgi:outer membrane protein TolC
LVFGICAALQANGGSMRRDVFYHALISGAMLSLFVSGCATPSGVASHEATSFSAISPSAEADHCEALAKPSEVYHAAHATTSDVGASAETPAAPLPPAEGSAGDRTNGARAVGETLRSPAASLPSAADRAPVALDLTEALSIAGGQSPEIAFAAARYREAYARLESARALWLPSIRAGVSFNHHDGPLQGSDGNVIDVSRSSLQSGLGAGAVGAGSPAVPGVVAQFHATDVVYQPKIAAHAASARNAASRTACNDTLLAASLAYLDLLRTVQELRIAEETEAHARNLFDLTKSFAATGQGSQADADRAEVDLVRRRNDVSRAHEAARVASARLAEILSLDPTVEIVPQEPTIVPIDLVSVAEESALADLVATGLSNRPELAEARALVCEAVSRYRRERNAPLIPSVLLGVSESGFGGGLGSEIDHYGSRFDFDAVVFWEIRNLGFGEKARREEASAQYAQMRARQAQTMDRVAREVVESSTQVRSRRRQIEIAESGILAANHSYQRNLTRIREGQGLPIEVLQAIAALDDARREYLRTVVDYNAAQFRLQRALGWPVQ